MENEKYPSSLVLPVSGVEISPSVCDRLVSFLSDGLPDRSPEAKRFAIKSAACAMALFGCAKENGVSQMTINVPGVVSVENGSMVSKGNWSVSLSDSGEASGGHPSEMVESFSDELGPSFSGFTDDEDASLWEAIRSSSSVPEGKEGVSVMSALSALIRENSMSSVSEFMKLMSSHMVNLAVVSGKRELFVLLDKDVTIEVRNVSSSIAGAGVVTH